MKAFYFNRLKALNIEELLDGFDPISLDRMNSVKLLDRMDTKYMFHVCHLEDILAQLKNDYFILTIEGNRFSHYETVYYDTSDYEMYTQHQNGKLNRYKVRLRTYVDSNLNFFEIKFKTNKGRTIKKRVQLEKKDLSIAGEAQKLLEKKTNYEVTSLKPAMQVNYKRITLISKNMTERLTIDFGLSFTRGKECIDMANLVITEIKQNRSGHSPFTAIMLEKRIKSTSLSKYCLGMASIVENIKINNFKSKLRYVNQLLSSNA